MWDLLVGMQRHRPGEMRGRESTVGRPLHADHVRRRRTTEGVAGPLIGAMVERHRGPPGETRRGTVPEEAGRRLVTPGEPRGVRDAEPRLLLPRWHGLRPDVERAEEVVRAGCQRRCGRRPAQLRAHPGADVGAQARCDTTRDTLEGVALAVQRGVIQHFHGRLEGGASEEVAAVRVSPPDAVPRDRPRCAGHGHRVRDEHEVAERDGPRSTDGRPRRRGAHGSPLGRSTRRMRTPSATLAQPAR